MGLMPLRFLNGPLHSVINRPWSIKAQPLNNSAQRQRRGDRFSPTPQHRAGHAARRAPPALLSPAMEEVGVDVPLPREKLSSQPDR